MATQFTPDFVVSAVTKFVEEAAAAGPGGRDRPLTDLSKLDSLVTELEKQLHDKKRAESAVTIASALPVLTANTKDLMHAVARAKQLVKLNSQCVAAQLDPRALKERELNVITSPKGGFCGSCGKLSTRIEALEAENTRLRQMVATSMAATASATMASSSATLGPSASSSLPEWQPVRMSHCDPIEELAELEAALSAVESLKSRFDRIEGARLGEPGN